MQCEYLAPPAAAGALVGDEHRGAERIAEAAGRELGEVVVEVRRRHHVHRHRRPIEVGDDDLAAVLEEAEPGRRPRRLAGAERAEELGENRLALAADDDVDPREAALELRAHRPVAVRAAEDDADRRIGVFQAAREPERREVLAEGGGEADDARPLREERRRALVEKAGREPAHLVELPQPLGAAALGQADAVLLIPAGGAIGASAKTQSPRPPPAHATTA